MPGRPAVGSRAKVWHGNADHTSGGLTKDDLLKNSKGRIVPKSKHQIGKVMGKRNLGLGGGLVDDAIGKAKRVGSRAVLTVAKYLARK